MGWWLQIQALQYHIQHESIPLSEEKQILREIKQLEGTREKVIANAAMRAKLQDSMVHKEAIQDQVKVRNFEVEFNPVLRNDFCNAINARVLRIVLM